MLINWHSNIDIYLQNKLFNLNKNKIQAYDDKLVQKQ